MLVIPRGSGKTFPLHRINDGRRFIGEPVTLDIDGTIIKVTIVCIEFESGVGPLFLLQTNLGTTFWLTRKGLREYEVRTNNN